MTGAGIAPGEHALASTMEAFADTGDLDQVLALMGVRLWFSRGILLPVFLVIFLLLYRAVRLCVVEIPPLPLHNLR